MNNAVKNYTRSGKIKRPSYSLVASWVKEGWDAVDVNMIKRSFKCCGVSNTMDGTEDALIFDFDRLGNRANRLDFGRGVERENESEDGDESDESDESELEDSDHESGSEENSESESEDSGSEDYYKNNEQQDVVQDWDC